MPFPFASQRGPPLYIFKTNPPLNIWICFVYRANTENHQGVSPAIRGAFDLILFALYIIPTYTEGLDLVYKLAFRWKVTAPYSEITSAQKLDILKKKKLY